jgi:hypothetical protein
VHGQTLEHYLNITEMSIDCLLDSCLSSCVVDFDIRLVIFKRFQDITESQAVWNT